jgi:hypothetical protein
MVFEDVDEYRALYFRGLLLKGQGGEVQWQISIEK